MDNEFSLVYERDDFLTEIWRLKNSALQADSTEYLRPPSAWVERFKTIARLILEGDIPSVLTRIEELDYELTLFQDQATDRQYYRLTEIDNSSNKFSRGAGSYFFNLDATAKGMVEVPHTLADTNTEYIGAKAFIDSNSRVFLLAGAHRDAGSEEDNYADVCDCPRKVFQGIHEAGVDAGLSAWQIHGFDPEGKDFPADTIAVLSDGRGEVTPAIEHLDRQLESDGFVSYAYIRRDEAPSEAVNGDVRGDRFWRLGARQNIQGQYSNDRNLDFVHIELTQKVRWDEREREGIAKSIGNSILAVSTQTI